MAIEAKPQYGFLAGEVSPNFYGRTDLTKYDLGAKLLKNFYVEYRGGASSRSGTQFFAPAFSQTSAKKMFRFKATGNDYIVVFEAGLIYFIRNGGLLLNAAATITDITYVANPVFTTGAAHGYSVGDFVYISGVDSTNKFNGRYFKIAAVPSATTFTITSIEGGSIDLSGETYAASSGSVAEVVTVTTTYTADEIEDLRFEQRYASAVVTHLNHAPARLTYVSDTNWTLTDIVFASDVPAPINLAITPSAAGSAGTAFVVTAVIDGVESVGSAYEIETAMVNYTTTAGSAKLTWDAVSGADYYNVYRSLILPIGTDVTTDQEAGYIGKALGESFTDTNIIPDFTKTPPVGYNPFDSGNNPRTFKIFQQRGVYGGSESLPMTIWGSKPNAIDNFDVSNVVNSGDSYSYTFDGDEIAPIYHLVILRNGMLAFTANTVSLVRAEEGVAVTALNALTEPQAYKGTSSVPPVQIDLDVVFAEEKSSSINAMQYTEYTNTFELQDVSVLSNHLVGEGKAIKRMGWAPEPNKLIYLLREDGRMLTLTYEREQQVFGWAQHQTKGYYKDFCIILEDNREVVYYVVRRYLNGAWVDVLERQQKREFDHVEDYWGVDCGLSNTLTTPAYDLTLTVSSGVYSVTTDASVVSAWAVGDVIFALGGKFEIASIDTATSATLTALREHTEEVPEGEDVLPEVAAGDWSWVTPIATVEGLWHLEGKEVSVLADGDAYLDVQVTDGKIALNKAYAKIKIGLPYVCDLETLPIALRTKSVEHKRKSIVELGTRVKDTRGLEYGETFDNLYSMKDRTDEDWGDPLQPRSQMLHSKVDTTYDNDATLCFRQRYPLPATILSLTTDVDVGDE